MVILSNLDLYFNVISIKFISFEDDVEIMMIVLGGIILFTALYYLWDGSNDGKENDNSKSLAYCRTDRKDIDN